MPRNIFVTGIGTGVGKTIISALLCRSTNYAYWKPIQCGDLDRLDCEVVRSLAPGTDILPSRFELKAPMSPHAAARLENIQIRLEDFTPPERPTVIEGAGGALVPLNDTDFIIDLVPRLDAAVVVVVPYYLGSINHTLLTLNELKSRELPVLGLIFNGEENKESRRIILAHHPLPVLMEHPKLHDLNDQRKFHVHLPT